MRFIPTFVHAMLDYAVGIVLILAPYVFGFSDGTAAQYVPQALGLAAIVYSLFTNYELGWRPVLSMPAHLSLDALSGILLAVSPWLFDFSDRIVWPHLFFGLFEILAALMTHTRAPEGSTANTPRLP